MSDLTVKTRALVLYLRSAAEERLQDPALTQCHIFRDWLEAVYNAPSFLARTGYLACYSGCRGRNVRELNLEEVQGCITFLVRQMRNQYPPYSCIVSGEMKKLLERWLELTEEGKE